jgi:hypothetical protein
MKWVVTIFFLPILASAQVSQPVSKSHYVQHTTAAFLATDGSMVSTSAFENHLREISEKRSSFKNEEAFLQFAFNKTHRKFLKDFEAYATFGQLLKHGSYNCLTATALYALILEQVDIKYEIIETNYHIFLLAYTTDGIVLIETTDRVNGFVADAREIEKRTEGYKQNTLTTRSNLPEYFKLDCNLYNIVHLEEMTGLLHYNMAIAAFNDHQVDAAIAHLDQATTLYSSPRMEAVTRVVLLSVVESKLDQARKASMIKRIQTFRKRNLMALASASR